MKEREVTCFLKIHFERLGLVSRGKLDIFNHVVDDASERSFKIDHTFGPEATKGERTNTQKQIDNDKFDKESKLLMEVISLMKDCCVFPQQMDLIKGWIPEPNPNPVVGIAVEVENAKSKYFRAAY